jgi:GNAT superfamily N-acetyltransferase
VVEQRRLRIEPLGAEHDRTSFACGNEDLDRYFRQTAGQDLRRHVSAVFVLIELDFDSIAGFYTLSAFSVEPRDLPLDFARRFPRRPLPVTLIGRFAVDLRFRNQGLGRLLLIDALVRSVRGSRKIGAMAVIVDAIDDSARSFYERFGFRRFHSNPHRLFLPMSDAERVVARALGESSH